MKRLNLKLSELLAETEVLGRMLEQSVPTIQRFPMPAVAGFDGSATELNSASEVALWTWDYPMLVGLFSDSEALEGIGGSLGNIKEVPFSDVQSLSGDALYVWVEYQPPISCMLDGSYVLYQYEDRVLIVDLRPQ